MAGPKLDLWLAGSLAKTVDVHIPDFTTDVTLDGTTYNVTSGIQEGIGPRYAFAPIPGHMDTEAVPNGKNPGLMKAESGFGIVQSLNRTKVYGIIPIQMGGAGAAINTPATYYAVLLQVIGRAGDGSVPCVDLVFLSTNTEPSTNEYRQSSYIYDGLSGASLEEAIVYSLTELQNTLVINSTSQTALIAAVQNWSRVVAATNYVSFTTVTVNGSDNAAPWLAAYPTTNGSLNVAPKLNFWACLTQSNFGGSVGDLSGGLPPQINYGTFNAAPRTAIIYTFKAADGTTNGIWKASFTPQSSYFNPAYLCEFPNGAVNTNNYDISSVTASMIVAPADYTLSKAALLNDTAMLINSSYRAVLVAANKPICFLIQDWARNTQGALQQDVDLLNMTSPQIQDTATYTENGAQVKTCFGKWPAFTDGVVFPGLADFGTALGAGGSGILRANTVYEFAYSIYDKRLNYESNVGAPARVQTDATDFVSLILVNKTTSNLAIMMAHAGEQIIPWPGNGTYGKQPGSYINYWQYRFYYRQLGMQEWLPAVFVDAAQWWLYPFFNSLSACTGGIGGAIGGRPGGWQDYSKLPSDQYNCVVSYKNRAFWISPRAMQASLPNNIFAYPQRNSIAAPSGEFKGGLVQAYYGQASQDARLVVFTTKGTYVGKFTGIQASLNVQISTANSATLPLDFSDFVLNPWTSVTAFSYRSAVVAEGILYFWGPQGVFMDDGVNPITRISVPLEPDIFGYYDPSLTDAICTLYNDTTKEILWFFTPKTADSYPTHALVYNTVKKTWLFAKFNGQVDAAQTLRIDTSIGTAGSRAVVFSRQNAAATVQRAYFFDQNNRSGDIFPTHELMVKTISTPSTGVRRFTMAAGYNSSNFATIAVNDLICLQQNSSYASSLSNPADMIATVNAINTGAGTLDINLPTGVTFDGSATISNNYQFFPIWHATPTGSGINGFPYVISSKYWIPNGMAYWAYWLYLHLLFKFSTVLASSSSITTTLAYRTPISGGTQSDTLTLSQNSDGNCQILHSLIPASSNFEGQGIRFSLSGTQIGSQWVLQFIEAYSQMKDGLQLKIFEG